MRSASRTVDSRWAMVVVVRPRGDPVATREAVLEIVDAEAPPLRVFSGDAPLGIATADHESRLAEWNAWDALSKKAHG